MIEACCPRPYVLVGCFLHRPEESMIQTQTHNQARGRAHVAPCVALIALWVASIASGCATTTTERLGLPPLQTVAKVDLSRYTGTWYEIASYPQRFQKGCTGTTATYTLRDDGEIGVVNRCRKGSLDGEEDSAHPSNRFSGGGVMVVVAASGRVTGVPKVRFVRLA